MSNLKEKLIDEMGETMQDHLDGLTAPATMKRVSKFQLDAALATLKAEGWQLVPVEPTEEMLRLGATAFLAQWNNGSATGYPIGEAWSAMLSAAPNPMESEDD